MLKRFFADLKEYRFFCVYMARACLRAEVANSYLNWIWWVLEPLCSMLVYYAIFAGILGRDRSFYVVFVYVGTLCWSYFERCMLYAVQAVRLNRDIVTKTYVPKPVLLLSNILFNSFKMLFSIGILAVLMAVQRVPVTVSWLGVLPALAELVLLTFGCGLLFMHFGVFVDDLSHALRILLRILFYLTGVFYDLEAVLPSPWGRLMICLNPVACVLHTLRGSLLDARMPGPETAVWFLLSCTLCLAGLALSYRYENTYVKVI